MRIVSLHRYPVKGLRGVPVARLEFDSAGPVGDRRLMLIDKANRFVSQRTLPRMALLSAALDGTKLELADDGGRSASFVLNDAASCSAHIWSDTVNVTEQSAAASEFISDFLKHACRLVKMHETWVRPVDARYVATSRAVYFADAYPVLVTSVGSLAALNQRLHSPIDMSRFRANVVVDANRAFDEDHWHSLRAGELMLDLVKPCVRCAVVNTDQISAKVDAVVLKTLAQLHTLEGFGPVFGMNAVANATGALEVGQSVEVVQRRTCEWKKLVSAKADNVSSSEQSD
jgi:uncharacterized protein